MCDEAGKHGARCRRDAPGTAAACETPTHDAPLGASFAGVLLVIFGVTYLVYHAKSTTTMHLPRDCSAVQTPA
jgi:hypothetical protein